MCVRSFCRNVVGALDGTHIPVPGERISPLHHTDYYNRKQFYSFTAQVVVDSDGRILDVFVGTAGSVHDSRVWKLSPLCANLLTMLDFAKGEVLLADSGYALRGGVIVPYKEDYGELFDFQKRFNYLHSCLRIIIEMTFGKLKMRFPQLRNLNMDVLFGPDVVTACCVLHNFLLDSEALQDQLEPTDQEDNEPIMHELEDGGGGVGLGAMDAEDEVDAEDPRSRAAGLRRLNDMLAIARVDQPLVFREVADPRSGIVYQRPGH